MKAIEAKKRARQEHRLGKHPLAIARALARQPCRGNGPGIEHSNAWIGSQQHLHYNLTHLCRSLALSSAQLREQASDLLSTAQYCCAVGVSISCSVSIKNVLSSAKYGFGES